MRVKEAKDRDKLLQDLNNTAASPSAGSMQWRRIRLDLECGHRSHSPLRERLGILGMPRGKL